MSLFQRPVKRQQISLISSLVCVLSILRDNYVLFNNNMSAQKIAHAVSSKRTKHIDLRFHYAKKAVADGLVDLRHLSSQEMLADVD